uniref:Uncharacterized protein n=1 Tax=Lactuca sativa TaxID=4236 RepID=A0A9R1WLJ4_LACSA|nr:hypothetical protein LSAT_V11C100038250 [Lactuca sativa]
MKMDHVVQYTTQYRNYEDLVFSKIKDQLTTIREHPTLSAGIAITTALLLMREQVREHIRGLRQWVGQSKEKVEKNQALEHSMSENSCQLCVVEKMSFEPCLYLEEMPLPQSVVLGAKDLP